MDTKTAYRIGKIVLVPRVWSCPCCGTMNVDYKELTVLPVCENCQEAFSWEELPEVEE